MKQTNTIFYLVFFTVFLYTNVIYTDTDKEVQSLHRYFLANYDLKNTQHWYDEIFSNNNASIHAYKGYIYLLRNTGKFKEIVTLIPKLEQTSSIANDPAIQIIFIQALEKVGHRKEAINRLIEANNKHKGDQEIAFFTANLYLQRKELKNALIVIDNFLQNCTHKPNNFIFYFLKGQILVNLNQKKQALEQIKKCLEIHPSFDKGWLLYALLKEQEESLDDAIKAYIIYLDLTGGNKSVENHLLQLILKQKMHKKQSKRITIDASILKNALLLFEQKRYHDALEYLQQHLNKESCSSKIQRRIHISYRSSKYKKSLLRLTQLTHKTTFIYDKQALIHLLADMKVY